MNRTDLQLLYEYNYWATKRIVAAATDISQEQLLAQTSLGFDSLRDILLHMLDTEYGWRMRCQHATAANELDARTFPTLDAIVARWREEEQAMRTYLAEVTDDDLADTMRYATDAGELRERMRWHCLLHVVNHGTQHRSEAAALLTEYGYSPGDLDFTVFLSERG